MKFKNKFAGNILYLLIGLIFLLVLSYKWVPPGYAVLGHDSGLPLDAKAFLQTRLYAWDSRLDFGLDNSVNFGSLTIHFFDWASSVIAGVPYAGNFISVFFWLGLIFISGFFFAIQLKDVFGKPFIFIFPPLMVFNFYVFQSVFMLERGKFGVLSATLIALGAFLRMQSKKNSLLSASLISALAFSVFNGGGLFAITLFGGVALILGVFLLQSLARGLAGKGYEEFKLAFLFVLFNGLFFAAFNAYAIVPYVTHYLEDNPSALFQQSLISGNIEWARYVSRSTSFLNLFRFFGVPDWYGAYNQASSANISHPYAGLYLNDRLLSSLAFIFPLLSFLGLLLAKKGKQRMILGIFAVFALLGMFLAAGSHSPLGFLYEEFMQKVPGFVLFRSAFYKFGVFYIIGMLVLFCFTLSFLINKISNLTHPLIRNVLPVFFVAAILTGWGLYHWVLLDSSKVFAWKQDQTTKAKVPQYVFDFAKWTERNDLGGKRVLFLPPVNKDWKSDAYKWGYWSLSPLPYALSSVNILSHWHGLNSVEEDLVDRLYSAIKEKDESKFVALADRLNTGYLLLRNDVLIDSNWSASEKPESYKKAIDSFQKVEMIQRFGEWDLYKVKDIQGGAVSVASLINFAPDKYLAIANDFFDQGRVVGNSAAVLYPDIKNLESKRMEVYDCLSCPLERKPNVQSLPEVSVLPNSIFYSFKIREEQKLLLIPKDPESKMADYLGLVLRKSSEQKRMIDLSIKDKYLIQNAQTIRLYLDKIYEILQTSPEKSEDFETANQVLDYINPGKQYFTQYVKSRDFSYASRDVVDNTLGIVWGIDRITDFFAPLSDNPEKWSNLKVYKVNLSQATDNYLYLPTDSYPKDPNGEIILPETLELKKGSQSTNLKIEQDKKGWLKARVEGSMEGEAELIIHFHEFPNILSLETPTLEKFAYGDATCIQGNITNFDKTRAYEVRVWKTSALRPIKVIFSDKTFVYSDKHKFLQGEDSFEVSPDASHNYARYVFFPSVSADVITLFICGDSQELPPLEKIEVREFFSPPVIGITGSYRQSQIANVNFVHHNPTSYEAQVDNIKTPYVLIFNEKFDPSWKLFSIDENGKETKVSKHFEADGYANAWFIEGGKKFRIYYEQQKTFQMAGTFSLISYVIGISWLVILSLKKKGKNEN